MLLHVNSPRIRVLREYCRLPCPCSRRVLVRKKGGNQARRPAHRLVHAVVLSAKLKAKCCNAPSMSSLMSCRLSLVLSPKRLITPETFAADLAIFVQVKDDTSKHKIYYVSAPAKALRPLLRRQCCRNDRWYKETEQATVKKGQRWQT